MYLALSVFEQEGIFIVPHQTKKRRFGFCYPVADQGHMLDTYGFEARRDFYRAHPEYFPRTNGIQ